MVYLEMGGTLIVINATGDAPCSKGAEGDWNRECLLKIRKLQLFFIA
jgi:hypothetical protein